MKRVSVIAAAILSIFTLTAHSFAQSTFLDLFTSSVGQSIFRMSKPLNLHLNKSKSQENINKSTEQLAPAAVIFSDNFGTVAQNPIARTGYTPFSTGSSAWELRTTTASSGYVGASGGANVFTNLSGASITKTLTYDNSLSTVGYNSISVSFGGIRSGTAPNLEVLYSTDGATYANAGSVTLGTAWALYTVNLPTDAAGVSNLRIRFQIATNNNSSNNIRIDDFSVQGNPVLPNLSINDVSQNEGNSGTTNLNFTVSLSSPAPAGGVTFDIATADGTATVAGNDYAANSLTAQTISAGNSTYSFTVAVNGDTTVEINETFFVNVTNVTGATVTDGQGQGTIDNDDVANNAPTVSANPASQTITVGNSGSSALTITDEDPSSVTLSASSNNQALVSDANISFTGTGAERTMNVLPTTGQTGTAVITVTATDNVMQTGTTTYTLTVNAAAGATVSPTVVNVSEDGGTAVYSIFLNTAPTANVNINVSPAFNQVTVAATSCLSNKSGKAQQNLGTVGLTLVFTPANYATPQCVLVTAIDDADVEGDHLDFIDHLASSSDTNYDGISIDFVEVQITDNESDSIAPIIFYQPLPVQEVETFGPRIVPNISDEGSGVVGFGENRPRLYFNKNGGEFVSVPCNADGDFFCDFDYRVFGGVSQGDIISYFIVAQDGFGNIGSNPFGITGTNVNNIVIPEGYAPNAFAIGDTVIPAGNYSTINVNGGVLGGNVQVLSSMSFSGVITVPNPFVLEIDCEVMFTGGSETAFISGSLRKNFCTSDTNDFLFPVGTTVQTRNDLGVPSGYSPVNVTITNLGADPSSLTISAVDTFLSGSNIAQSISRYWNVTETGDVTANMTFSYRNEDVPVGSDEATFKVLRRETSTLVYSDETTVDETANTGTASNVSNFSQWGIGNLAPTAAAVSVSGAVRAGSTLLNGVTVMLTGGNLAQPVYTRTNSFGNYQFEGLTAGQTYVVTVLSKRYNFPQSSIILNVDDNVINADFEAEER